MACWRAAFACMTADMAGTRIDMAAALAVAQALGASPEVTGELLVAIADGMAEAQVKQAKERRDDR
jgi:hypothetical protein